MVTTEEEIQNDLLTKGYWYYPKNNALNLNIKWMFDKIKLYVPELKTAPWQVLGKGVDSMFRDMDKEYDDRHMLFQLLHDTYGYPLLNIIVENRPTIKALYMTYGPDHKEMV
jgi:hypothetical protein